ncbi:MAG: hypothetical protein KME42_18755 [Tildeniella nuda ZEHNDER 1965/U140]|nr:hypothetical protein [Tildeniella nuda ZEHNDER 1965/U140]
MCYFSTERRAIKAIDGLLIKTRTVVLIAMVAEEQNNACRTCLDNPCDAPMLAQATAIVRLGCASLPK